MIHLTVLLVTVASICLAQPETKNNTAQYNQQRTARAPQSQIQYNDPNGLRVDWKQYVPENQWRAPVENSQRAQRADSDASSGSDKNSSPKQTNQPQLVQAQVQQYQPYSAIPEHIKQLMYITYGQQGPYVDPGAFIYQTHVPAPISSVASQVKEDQSALSQTQVESTYYNSAVHFRSTDNDQSEESNPRRQIGRIPEKKNHGTIKYAKDDDPNSGYTYSGPVIPGHQTQGKPQYQSYQQVQHEPQTEPSAKPISHMSVDKNMPMAIQQLLHYQAQLPYNVIANHIVYRPKQLFIPKPLPESAKLARSYPSKIYLVKTDGEVYESTATAKDAENSKPH